MAPLTRLELRRAAAEPILLRLLCSLSPFSSSFFASSPLRFFSRLPPALLSSKCEISCSLIFRYLFPSWHLRSNMKYWSALNLSLSLSLSPPLFHLFFFSRTHILLLCEPHKTECTALHKPPVLCSSNIKSSTRKKYFLFKVIHSCNLCVFIRVNNFVHLIATLCKFLIATR